MSDLYSVLKRAGLATKLSDTVFAAGGQIARNALQVYLGDSAQALQFDEPGLAQVQTAAHLAPFGWGEQTMQDTAVRDTWEINGSALQLAWQADAEQNLAEQVSRALCLPETLNFSLSLHKLLLYKPGQFFKPHTDSEKAPGMLATLVLVLPSAHRGGLLQVNHGKLQQTFASELMQPGQLNWFAFYADCPHQVLPVESGNRVVLTFNLCLTEISKECVELVSSDIVSDISERFSRDYIARKKSFSLPLSHRYTRDGLRWHLLKGQDILLAKYMRQVCQQTGMSIWLAQFRNVTEYELSEADLVAGHWCCEDELYPSYHSYQTGQLHHLVDGNNITLPEWCEVVDHPTSIHCGVSPQRWDDDDNAVYAGWSGNQGQHVKAWYHGAAIFVCHDEAMTGLLALYYILLERTAVSTPEQQLAWEEKICCLESGFSDYEGKIPAGLVLDLLLLAQQKRTIHVLVACLDLSCIPLSDVPSLISLFNKWGESYFAEMFINRSWYDYGLFPASTLHVLLVELQKAGMSTDSLVGLLQEIIEDQHWVLEAEIDWSVNRQTHFKGNVDYFDWRTGWNRWAAAVTSWCRAAYNLKALDQISGLFNYSLEKSDMWLLELAEAWLDFFSDVAVTDDNGEWYQLEHKLLEKLEVRLAVAKSFEFKIPVSIECPAYNGENSCASCSTLQDFSRSYLSETTLTTTPMKAAHMVEQIAFYRLPIASRLQEDGRNSQFQMTKTAQLQLDLADRRQRMQRCIAEFQRRSISAGQA